MQKHILVVDDEPQIRELLALYLDKNGFRVSTASNSNETMDLVRTQAVDVVILDIGLAEEDGLNLLTQLKEEQPQQHVIMLTGMGFVEDVIQEAISKGADGYVNKALPLSELLMAIEPMIAEGPSAGMNDGKAGGDFCGDRAA